MPNITLSTLSPAEVASNCSEKSCYVLIGCNVYDVTGFLQVHPGDEDLIIRYGGKDVGAIMGDELCTMPNITLSTLSPAEVASHCSEKSCYVLIGCNVYDVTGFLQVHPGDEDLIIRYGGKDVGAIMGDELQSESPYKVLEEYLNGILSVVTVTGARTAHEELRDIAPLLPDEDDIALNANRAAKRLRPKNNEPPLMQVWRYLTDEYRATKRLRRKKHLMKNDINAEYIPHQFLDLDTPLLMQVWRGNFSSDFYVEQIHRPRHYKNGNSAPILGNSLEPLTMTTWWIVPIIWLPPIIYSFHYALERLTPTRTAAFCVLGLGLWSFFEYGWHRWICHLT